MCAVWHQQLPGQWLLYGFRVGPEQLRAWLRVRDNKWDDARPIADHELHAFANGYFNEQRIGTKAVALFRSMCEDKDMPAEPRYLLVCWARRVPVGRRAPLPEDKRGVLAMARYWLKGMPADWVSSKALNTEYDPLQGLSVFRMMNLMSEQDRKCAQAEKEISDYYYG
jgi:hypothetical protein